MKDIIRILTALTVLVGGNGKPQSGYCIGSQCFAVFQNRADFPTAQQHCERQHGNLMTVRSSVSHDIISVLLDSLNGYFWIGLHLQSGHCPVDDSDLRGYKWITGDNATDFHNWGTEDTACSDRCVSVSNRGYKWIEQSCNKEIAGFLCEYYFENICNPFVVSGGESVEYMTPLGFRGEDMASLPPGSTAIHSQHESKYICLSEKWMQEPWHCEVTEGGCDTDCLSVDPNVCICPPGKVQNDNNVTCEYATTDPCLDFGCVKMCYQNQDGLKSCFTLAESGKVRRDVNTCVKELHCPGDNFECVNTANGFECRCQDGYMSENGMCVDIDECNKFLCEHKCTNTKGSYKCSCYDGYITVATDPNMCKLHCPSEECPAECDPNNKDQCNCPEGYIIDHRDDEGVYCLDINECDMAQCQQQCINSYGSFVCLCDVGYVLVDGTNCQEETLPTVNPSWFTTPSDVHTPPLMNSTSSPSVVTAGGLLGIVICIVIVILVMVLFAHYFLKQRGQLQTSNAPKTQGDDLHDLQEVTTEKCQAVQE
ncbi:thrombomodulin-like [Osmerus mordax]|uniref:thrombomodulin-like n=1 Tax=Osmerus mordax TaxID=8014 RepID=UPI003510C382